MYCPNCGIDDQNSRQFCRGCGTDLNPIRTTVGRRDTLTAAPSDTRDQIGQAIAARIRELKTAGELKKVVEEVLPQVEKFLESPEQRRARYVGGGILIASIGLAFILSAMLLLILSQGADDTRVLSFLIASVGILLSLIGGGIFVSARWFSLPRKYDSPPVPRQLTSLETGEIADAERTRVPSVTEATTRDLR